MMSHFQHLIWHFHLLWTEHGQMFQFQISYLCNKVPSWNELSSTSSFAPRFPVRSKTLAQYCTALSHWEVPKQSTVAPCLATSKTPPPKKKKPNKTAGHHHFQEVSIHTEYHTMRSSWIFSTFSFKSWHRSKSEENDPWPLARHCCNPQYWAGDLTVTWPK